MPSIRQLLRTLWSLYGSLVFIVVVLLYMVPALMFSLTGGTPLEAFRRWSYRWVPRALFWPCLIRVKAEGVDGIDPSRQYILVSNHQSFLDIFANGGCSPVFFRYLAKAEVARMPVIGRIASMFCVYVDRTRGESRRESFKKLVQAIEGGDSVLVYPEGTRNRSDDPLERFHDGAFRLAIATKRPLVVQTVLNSRFLSDPNRRWDLAPGTIRIIWDAPIATDKMTTSDLGQLKEQVQQAMRHHLQHA